jgi:hypothetical protein
MDEGWLPLILLAATLLPLLWVKRWLTIHMQELAYRWVGDPDVALILYFVVVLPGVVVHELSHWLAATMLGVPVRRLSIGPVLRKGSRRVSFGSVQVSKVDPLRGSLIGLAPLLGGTAVILLIGNLVLGVRELAGTVAGQGGAEMTTAVAAALRQVIQLPDLGLWLYLIFAVSNAMLPSDSDLAAVRPVLIFLGIAAAIVLIVGGLPAIPPGVVQAVNRLAGYLASVFGMTLAVDLIFVAATGALIWLSDRLRR